MAEFVDIGSPANEAERLGFRLLRDQLPDHYTVLGNFDMRLPNRRSSMEFDAVVIGEYGFFAVEIKGWTGRIKGNDREWVLPWERKSNPLIYLERKTKALGQFVHQRVDGLPDTCFFAPTMFFPRGEVQFELPTALMDCIIGPDQIWEYFVDLDLVREFGPGPLRSEQKTQEVLDAIVDVSEPTQEDVVLRYYDVEGELDVHPRQPYREFIGSHGYLTNRPKVRIKAYSMDPLESKSRQRDEQNRVLRDMEALEVLDDNPYTARSYEMQPGYHDEPVFYLISEWVGSRNLKDRIDEMCDEPDCHQERIQLSWHLVEALQTLHDAGIVHRNLSPQVFYLTGEESIPFKIADFDFARVSQLESIADAISHIGTDGYKAPELWLDEDYDHRVDIFSAGAILFELLTSEVLFQAPGALLEPEESWKERKDLVDNPELRRAIRGMISSDPIQRTVEMSRARQVLSTLRRN